jgi:2-beta-glucuronyltransferase
MPQVVLVSGHYYESKRKAGFHWLAHAYWQAGWDVLFITASISWISRMRHDSRFEYPILRERGRVKTVTERLSSYIWFTPWHPADLRIGLANRLVQPLFARYGSFSLGEAAARVKEADLIVMESTPGLLLFEQLKGLAPTARFAYRVSDDLRLIRNHPLVLSYEQAIAPRFDVVSSPCGYIHRYFAHLPGAHLHPHGINTEAFAGEQPNPYQPGTTNLVFVGNSHFDYDFLERASRLFPEVLFHIIGPIENLPRRDNIIAYGEIPFAQTIPYLRHADAGLQIRAYSPGAESLTDSLKVLQYTYCHIPYIAPEFLHTDRPNLFCYRSGNDGSVQAAVEGALRFDRAAVDWEHIRSWDELAALLAGGASAPEGTPA